MTDEGRRKRIQDALKAWHQRREPGETLPLFWHGQQRLFPVIELDLDVPLLNAKSHRVRAQLESDPHGDLVQKRPWTDEAQAVVMALLRKPEDEFEHLKENLARESQRHPGVITRDGVLYNANRRLVALRDLRNPEKRWIRVAVLDEDVEPKELAELELRLQVQEELKAEYSLTNELLFIEELARDYGMSDEQTAITLRWMTKRGQPDVDKVQQYRRVLALIREMQRVADPPVPLTSFDGRLEQLKALEQAYSKMFQDDPVAARRYRDAWLLTFLTGVSSVHQLRSVSDGFDEEYLVPRLTEHEVLREHAEALLRLKEMPPPPSLPGVNELAPEDAGTRSGSDLRPLISIFTSSEPTLTMPGGIVLDRAAVKDAIREAAKGAISDEKADDRAEDRLDEPVEQLREAVRHLKRVISSYRDLKGDDEFEDTRRSLFNYLLRQLRKLMKQLEDIESGRGGIKT